jgi:hypothetical protein
VSDIERSTGEPSAARAGALAGKKARRHHVQAAVTNAGGRVAVAGRAGRSRVVQELSGGVTRRKAG